VSAHAAFTEGEEHRTPTPIAHQRATVARIAGEAHGGGVHARRRSSERGVARGIAQALRRARLRTVIRSTVAPSVVDGTLERPIRLD
jgi:hypothetical protein